MILWLGAFLAFPILLEVGSNKHNIKDYKYIDGKIIGVHMQSKNASSRPQRDTLNEDRTRSWYSQQFNAIREPTPPQSTVNQDPNIIFISQLGFLHGHKKYKVINNRYISAFLGLKYGYVKSGLGRFQVIPVIKTTGKFNVIL